MEIKTPRLTTKLRLVTHALGLCKLNNESDKRRGDILIVLIDSDSLCYANAFAVEREGEVVENGDLYMYSKLERTIATIIEETNATDYKLFLSGKVNFRDEVYSLYKANREGMKRPKLLQPARDFLEIVHHAIVSDGIEADDMVCIEQTALMKQGIDCCIAHIDKDIDQQEGKHYRWALGKKPSEQYYITKEEGLQCLYQQALVGDKVDNIMYYLNKESGTWKKNYGLGKVGARKALMDCKTEKELYRTCLEHYETWTKKGDGTPCSQHDLDVNMQLLYLLRTENDKWERP